MRKILLLIALTAISLASHAQNNYLPVGNSLQRQGTGAYYNYRFNLGTPGFAYFYSKSQTDSLFNAAISQGITLAYFNSTTGTFTQGQINNKQPRIIGNKPAPTGTSYLASDSLAQIVSNLDSGIRAVAVTPNQFTGANDIIRIRKAIAKAAATSRIVIIPSINSRNGQRLWLLDSAALLPSNITVYIENTKLKLSDVCRDNFFRSDNCGYGITTVNPSSNIFIIGVGDAELEGADNPRSTGLAKSMYTGTRPNSTYSYGTDVNDPSQEQLGDWRNHAVLLAKVGFFKIQNLKFINVHGYSIMVERSNNGIIDNIILSNPNSVTINGITQGKLNLDGIDIINDSYNIEVNNITGLSGDDVTNIGIFDFTSGTRPEIPPGAYGGAVVVAGTAYTAGQDMRFINVRNMKATPTTNMMRLLPIGSAKIHDVILDGIEDTGTSSASGISSVIIGDVNTYGDQAPMTGIYNITIQNINTNFIQYGLRVRSGITSGIIRNIRKANLFATAPIVFDPAASGFGTDVIVDNVDFIGTSTISGRYNGKVIADNVTRATAGVTTSTPWIFSGPLTTSAPNTVLTLDSKGNPGVNRGPKLSFNVPQSGTVSVFGGGISMNETASSTDNTRLDFTTNVATVETLGLRVSGTSVNVPGLTASSAVATDASKNLVSVTNTGTGNNVLATSPILVTPNLGTPSAGVLTNGTGLPLTTGTTGVLPETKGGTNQSTYATGDLLYASAANTLSKRTIGATNNVLTVIGGVPTWVAPATSGTVTSITPGFGLTPQTTITSTGAFAVDTTLIATKSLLNQYAKLNQPVTFTNDVRFSGTNTTFTNLANNGYFYKADAAGKFQQSSLLRDYNNSITINEANSNPSAILMISSTSAGVMLPRMTLAQRNLMTVNSGSSSMSTLIYQTDNNPGYYYYDGANWNRLGTTLSNTVSSASTLTLSSPGAYTFTGTTSTWTLPSFATSGTYDYLINNVGSGDITVNTNGGEAVAYINGSGGYSTFTVLRGESYRVYNSTYGFHVIPLNKTRAPDNVFNVSANTTIDGTYFLAGNKSTLDLYVNATSGNLTITMPSATTFVGYTVYITKTDASANTVTINTVIGSNTLTATGQSRQFNSNNANWYNH